jgi:hypothetical protein
MIRLPRQARDKNCENLELQDKTVFLSQVAHRPRSEHRALQPVRQDRAGVHPADDGVQAQLHARGLRARQLPRGR